LRAGVGGAELVRAMTGLGLNGAQIGSNINGRCLDDPALEPVWAAADSLGALIMAPPTQIAGADRLKSHYLANQVGIPLDTTIAVAALVFGGVAPGSDYPYDMGTLECVREVTALPIADTDKAHILTKVPRAPLGEG
jgi:hypothetical protein